MEESEDLSYTQKQNKNEASEASWGDDFNNEGSEKTVAKSNPTRRKKQLKQSNLPVTEAHVLRQSRSRQPATSSVTPLLGHYTKPKGKVEAPKDEVFRGDWFAAVLESIPDFTWRNAIYAFHKNLQRHPDGTILAKDLTRTGN